MDKNLPRWIWASITRHFDERREGYPIFFEGYDRTINPQDSFEVRMDGPMYSAPSIGSEIIDIHINVLITSIKDDADAHKIHRIVGIVGAAFTSSISIYKLGDARTTLVGCMILQDPGIDIIHFGLVQPTNNILQATVEASYRMS